MSEALLISTDCSTVAGGLRMISAVLKRAGHSTLLVNLHGGGSRHPLRRPAVVQQLQEMAARSDLVGISSMAHSAPDGAAVARLLRPLGKPIVWGGIHATLEPESCLRHVDIVCVGEGEDAAVELAQALDAGGDITPIRNLWVRQDGVVHRNPLRPLVEDLDSLPLPDHDPSTEWVRDGDRLVPVGQSTFHPTDEVHTQALVQATRGCWMSCSYCLNSTLRTLYEGRGRYIRRYGPAHTVAMAKAALRANPLARSVWFNDDDFFLRPLAVLQELGDLYRSEVGVPFECYATPRTLSADKLAVVAQAGCYRVRVGIQSGSERTNREIYDRPIANDEVLAAAEMLRPYRGRVLVRWQVIVNNPYESEEDLRQTISLLAQLPHSFELSVYGLVLVPGTKLRDRVRRDWPHAFPPNEDEADFAAAARLTDRGCPYLNFLVSRMHGRSTALRIGSIPRALLGLLSSPHLARFHDARPFLLHSYDRAAAALRLPAP